MKTYENDGRAPDTTEALHHLSPRKTRNPSSRGKKTVALISKQSKNTQPQKTDSVDVAKDNKSRIKTTDLSHLSLQSYQWSSPNSCFWDHGQELLYRAFLLWPLDTRQQIKTALSSESLLCSMIYHFERRTKKASGIASNYHRELSMAQTSLRHAIFDKWKLHNVGEFGAADYWIHHAIMVCVLI